jgi:hypothetical protein
MPNASAAPSAIERNFIGSPPCAPADLACRMFVRLAGGCRQIVVMPRN